MLTSSRLAACALLSGLWLGCGADASDAEATAIHSGGSAGTTSAGGRAGGSFAAGSAGTGSNTEINGDVALSDECRDCLMENCQDLCPPTGPCDPCDSPPGVCQDSSSEVVSGLVACACKEQSVCGQKCASSGLCGAPTGTKGGESGAAGSGSGGKGQGQSGAAGAAIPSGGSGGASAGGAPGGAGAAGQPGGAGGDSSDGGGNGGESGINCAETTKEVKGLCADGLDNDCDTRVDCDDDECAASCALACAAPTPIGQNQEIHASLKGRQNSFDPTCTDSPSTGPDAAYLLAITEDGLLQVSLGSPAINMVLSLRQQCGGGSADLDCQDMVGAGTEQLSRLVKQGESYYLVVGAALPGEEGEFDLSVKLTKPVCGDGETQEGEQCDAGQLNGAVSASCSATCTLVACDQATGLTDASAPDYAFQPLGGDTTQGDSVLSPSCGQLGSNSPEQVYSIRPARSGRLEVQLDPAPGVDLTLSIRSACDGSGGELGCVDGARQGGSERISVPVTAGETYYVVVDGYDSAQKGQFVLKARSVPAVCGDQIPSQAEQCDGPDPSSCTARCTSIPVKGSLIDESQLGPGEALPIKDEAQSEIYPAGDVDTFALTLAPGQHQITATIAAAGLEGCAAGHLDSQLEILDAAGLLRAFNDDGAAAGGFCSQVIAEGLTEGETYAVRVRASQTFAPAQVFAYKLRVEAQ